MIKIIQIIKNLEHYQWIDKNKFEILPNKNIFTKNKIEYDITCNTQDYIKGLFYINKELEKLSTEENPIKLFHAIPLRTSIVQQFVTIDTKSIIDLIHDSKDYTNIVERQDKIWKQHFDFNNKIFKKKNYKFSYLIKTDGISVSLLFKRVDKDKNIIKPSFKDIKIMKTNIKTNNKQYIEKQLNIKDIFNNKNIVTINCSTINYSNKIVCLQTILL